MTELALKHGLAFSDLYERDGLIRLDRAFVAHLAAGDVALHDRLMAARANPEALDRKAESDLLVDLAPHLEDFIGELFGIAAEIRELQARHDELAPLYTVKRLFVQRRAVKEIKEADAAHLNGAKLGEELATLIGGPPADFSTRAGALAWELRYAEAVARWLDDEAAHKLPLRAALEYAAWATLSPAGRARHRRGLLFRVPHRLDMHHLVPVETIVRHGVTMLRLPEDEWRPRDGFALTDPGTDLAGALDQANYCIWCHNQQKDSCRSGLREKDGGFRKSVFGVTLAGCPLDEKISEMNLVKARGNSLGALAIVAVDNPLCAATGHRICNDCMKACIYQRQEPVDIPQIETRTLKDVLALPWGFEIYGLLTRWNPLDLRRPLPKPASGYKVLVVGLGPAGFNLAHHLINDGHFVAAIDGLEDRAAAAGNLRRFADRRARAVRADPRCRKPLRAARRAHDGRVRRGRRIRHHGALGQEFPQGRPPAARAPGAIRDVWRGALRRHADDRQRLRSRLRPYRAVRRRRPADRDPDEERPRARGAAGLRFSDGACS